MPSVPLPPPPPNTPEAKAAQVAALRKYIAIDKQRQQAAGDSVFNVTEYDQPSRDAYAEAIAAFGGNQGACSDALYAMIDADKKPQRHRREEAKAA